MPVEDRARRIKLLAMDVDGVFTNGGLWLSGTGEELKFFHFSDINGMTLAYLAGLKTALITGEESKATAALVGKLKGTILHQRAKDKLRVMEEILSENSLSLLQVGYVGDELNDLPLLLKVGFSVAVANAVPEVKEAVHYITQAKGGAGAVREVVTLILKAQGIWEKTLASYVPMRSELRVPLVHC